MRRILQPAYPILLTLLLCSSCSYVRLLRPSVIGQLNPRVTNLVDELPEVDRPDKGLVAELYALGGLSHAQEGPDGVMRTTVRVPPGRFLWQPAVIVMPHGGDLELTFQNNDSAHHMAFLPSNGARELLDLPPHSAGVARINLDSPGLQWFGCPVANHVGRGMLGFIFVYGDVPQQAKLDRPEQPRP